LLKWVVVGVVVVLVVGGGIAAFALGGDGDDDTPVLITAKVVRRDLREEVTVTGTLGRVEERTISVSGASASGSGAGSAGGAAGAAGGAGGGGATVSTVHVEDGGTPEAGQPILALDGRDSVTENGEVPFFRMLDVGATGVDVLQLEKILTDTGFSPGKIDQLYTERTRSALAQWQASHLYPGDNPTTDQTMTVSLQPGTGYTVGAQSSAAATIGPYVPPFKPAAFRSPQNAAAPARDAAVNAVVDGVANGGVDVVPAAFLACPPPPPTSTVTISGSATVSEGGSATITVTASPAPDPGCPIQVLLTAGGDATPGVDFNSFAPTVNLTSATPSASFALRTRSDVLAESTEHVLVSVAPSPSGSYTLGSPNSATVTITDAGVKPRVSLIPGVGQVPEGTPATFTIGLDKPLNVPLQVFLDFGGTALIGDDFSPPGGALIVPAGSASLPVTIPTLNDDRVEPDKVLTVRLQPRSAYNIGANGGDVLIASEDVPEVSIVGGSATSRGGSSLFLIVADQAPLVDTTVQYQATGTAQPGVDVRPLTGTVLLPAGATSAAVPLFTLNTDVVFIPTDIIVAQWPTPVSKVLVEAGDIVPAGTPLFSITESGFTVTLKASAGDRSDLEVGQQVTVQVQGGTASATGVITELDETATVDPETQQQTYEGKVQVQGDLGAADGAPVTIDVILEDKPGVLTVPIAAVKQNGRGQDVVRVIDLNRGGRIEERVVKTGLAEGSYIEITSGLKGNEVVVVEVDQGPA
jgi:hypothetical protein